MFRKFFISLITIAVIFTSACVADEKLPPNEQKDVPTEQKNFPTVKAESPFDGIDGIIAETLNDGTEYAVYLAFPTKSAEPFIYNSKPMRSASMIKVFILAAVMDKANRGELDIDETLTLNGSDKVGGAGILAGYASGTQLSLREVLELMITHSDNTATNIVIDRVGMDAINAYIKSQGYGDTVLRRKMMDYDAIAAGRENFSSVRDLGTIFLKLYNYECVNEKFDKIMLDFLVKQTDTDCFPAALPDKQIAHKTGALDGLYDDGGIIYSNAGDAVLVIMTENFTGEYNTIQHMKAFARAVIK
ncbi:MAG: serine hydrolase [Selenomonadaceae bacterium]|nr:serine hydrolase [Selenomonadaceae bacterium]